MKMHEIKAELKNRGVSFARTDKKEDLLRKLENSKSFADEKPVVGEPVKVNTKNAVTEEKRVEDELEKAMSELEGLQKRGLEWSIEGDVITFKASIETCANINQPARNIVSTAKAAFARNFYNTKVGDVYSA